MVSADRVTTEASAWWGVLAYVVEEAHSASGHDLGRMADRAVEPLGLSATIYLADRAQRLLRPLGAGEPPVAIDGTLPGRAFQLGQVCARRSEADATLWVPLVDGTERLGLLRIRLPAGTDTEHTSLHERCSALASLLGHVVATKLDYGDTLHVTRRSSPLTPAAELLWQLLPPQTFASEDLVISAVLEPNDNVGGDAFDYAVDEGRAFLGLFDAVGHDIQSGLTATLALAAIRNARRNGERDLGTLARHADTLVAENRAAGFRYVAAVLAWLDTRTGLVTYLVAGHPPPVLLRANKTVKSLAHGNGPRVPLGVLGGPKVDVGTEQLEPGDRLLFYTDGITEARDTAGRTFGIRRLIEFAEHSSASGLPAPESLRRLMHAVLDHQNGRMQDDATLLMVDWRPAPSIRRTYRSIDTD